MSRGEVGASAYVDGFVCAKIFDSVENPELAARKYEMSSEWRQSLYGFDGV